MIYNEILNYIDNNILVVTAFMPLIGVLLYVFLGNKQISIKIINIIVPILTLVSLSRALFLYHNNNLQEYLLFNIGNLNISYHLEPIGIIFSLVACILWIPTSIYTMSYMQRNNEKRLVSFLIFFNISIFSALSISFASNFMTLFIFYEVLTFATYPLVSHHRNNEAKKASRYYIGILLTTSVSFLLIAMAFITVNNYDVNNLNFNNIKGVVENLSATETLIITLLIFYGAGKAALFPIHKWLPSAMVAPTPVSSLLHAVAVVKAGVFTVIKLVVYIIGLDKFQQITQDCNLLVYISGFTIIFASFIALKQNSIKKMLAYSTISQLSYIIMSISIANIYGLIGSTYHIAAHAFSKITLFFIAGAIYTTSKKTNIDELAGIGKRMPLTMTIFALAGFAMIGLPPTSGIVTKYFIMKASIDSSMYFPIFVLIVSTVLNCCYFLPIIYKAFMEKENIIKIDHKESPKSMLFAIFITISLSIMLFLYPEIILYILDPVLVKFNL